MADFESDADLLVRATSGDRDALGQLMAACYGRLTRRVRRRLPAHSPLAAEDVVQEACLRAVAHGERLRPDGIDAFYGWLTTVVDRRLHDLLKAQRARKRGGAGRGPAASSTPAGHTQERLAAQHESQADPAAPAARPEQREACDAVREAVARLPESVRAVVQLRYMDGLSIAQVARRTGRSPRAVRVICHRALTDLRGRLAPQA